MRTGRLSHRTGRQSMGHKKRHFIVPLFLSFSPPPSSFIHHHIILILYTVGMELFYKLGLACLGAHRALGHYAVQTSCLSYATQRPSFRLLDVQVGQNSWVWRRCRGKVEWSLGHVHWNVLDAIEVQESTYWVSMAKIVSNLCLWFSGFRYNH